MEIEVLGNYICGDRISRSETAHIYFAQHLHPRQTPTFVALKRFSSSTMRDSQRFKTFERDSRAALQLIHPKIIRTLDVGHPSEGDFFVASEFIFGVSLSDLFMCHQSREQPLRLSLALFIFEQIAQGLAALHAYQKQVGPEKLSNAHFDASPSCVMIGYDGQVKIAPIHYDSDPAYGAPECASQAPGDLRSGIFSFGAMLWEFLAGQRLPEGTERKSPTAQGAPAPWQEPPLLQSLRPDVPSELSTLVCYCLKASPETRYQSLHDVHDDLKAIMNQLKINENQKDLSEFLKNLMREDWRTRRSKMEHFVHACAQIEARTPPLVAETSVFNEKTVVVNSPGTLNNSVRSEEVTYVGPMPPTRTSPRNLKMDVESVEKAESMNVSSRIPDAEFQLGSDQKFSFFMELLASPLYFAAGFLLTHFAFKNFGADFVWLLKLKLLIEAYI